MPIGIRLAAIAIVLAASASGQRYSFRFYGASEGLRSLAVQVLLQDQTGFIWAGTQNGHLDKISEISRELLAATTETAVAFESREEGLMSESTHAHCARGADLHL